VRTRSHSGRSSGCRERASRGEQENEGGDPVRGRRDPQLRGYPWGR
jgi:hypothetical protein